MVSIIVLSYNNLEYLFETLNSIFIQTYSDIELIIADDGSERFFESEIEKYIIENKKSNIKSYAILHNANNKGTVRNINNSLKICNGEIIKFIGADDLFFDKNVIEKVNNFMKKEKSLFLATNVQACDKSLKPIKSIEYFNKEMLEYLQNTNNIEKFEEHCRTEIKPPAPGFFFTKKLFEQYGDFDEDYFIAEDSPMWCRLLREGCRIDYWNLVSVKYRIGSGISTKKKSNPYLFFDKKKKIEKEIFKYKNLLSKNTIRINEYRYLKNYLWKSVDLKKRIQTTFCYFDVIVYLCKLRIQRKIKK